MDEKTLNKIKELTEQISKLPKGYISTKNIGNSVYYYHQWSVNGKKYSKYLSIEDFLDLSVKIKERQKLESELKLLKKGYSSSDLLFCSLMHQNSEVVDLTISLETGQIILIGVLRSKDLLPIGVGENLSNLLEWWNDRSIPLTRSGIKDALERLNISDPKALLLKCYALSLSDQYWIKPKNESIAWEDINFFDHDFSDDVGVVLLNGDNKKKKLDLSSPDSTSVGNLKKRWKIVNGQRVMIKGGSNPYRQEPFNEVIASTLANILGLNCTKYSLFYDDGYPYCECEDFIKKGQDLITAHQINKILKKNNSDSAYTHFVKCAQYLGIKDVELFLDKLIVFDYIIANEDRHFNNFGFIRDASSLNIISPAPIFDSGASFGFDKLTSDIKANRDIISKPFKQNPLEQLKLVKSFDWINISSLNMIKKDLLSLFSKYESKYLDKDRINAIVESTNNRIDYLINHYLEK